MPVLNGYEGARILRVGKGYGEDEMPVEEENRGGY